MRALSLVILVILGGWIVYASRETSPNRAEKPRPPHAVQHREELAQDSRRAARERAPDSASEQGQGEIDSLLALLEGDELRREERLQERANARARLEKLVTPQVVASAIQSMMQPNGDHKRAQLLLALVPEANGLDVLLDAPDPLVRLYARLRLHGPVPPEQIQSEGRFRLGNGLEPLPTEEMYRRLFVESKDRAWKEEFDRDYEQDYLPRLRAIDQHIPGHRRVHVDLDGDGADELFLDGTHLWETSWSHGEGFVAIVGSDGDLAWIHKMEEKTERVIVADANGDGTPEVYCWLAIEGHGATGLLGLHATGGGFLRTGHKWHEVGIADGPLFYAQSHYLQSHAGTYGIECGVLARKIELHRWSNGFWPAGELYLPLKKR
ncbi:MAG: VCBS repeat-containing protein [Planctomycetota bacterium]